MENSNNILAARSSNDSPITQNENTDNQENLIKKMTSVSLSSNALPAQKGLQQTHNLTNLSKSSDDYCADDSWITNNYNQKSDIKNNLKYHTDMKEELKELRQFFDNFDFPESSLYYCSRRSPSDYLVYEIQKSKFVSDKKEPTSFEPILKKIYNFITIPAFYVKETSICSVLIENLKLEPKDHALCYPVNPSIYKKGMVYGQILEAMVKDIDDDISKCKEHERRLNQDKR